MLYPLPDETLSASPKPLTSARALLTVQQFTTKYPAWTPGAVRNMIFHSHPRKSSRGPIPGNGLGPAIVRLGKKVMIDEAKFFEWLDSQQRSNAA